MSKYHVFFFLLLFCCFPFVGAFAQSPAAADADLLQQGIDLSNQGAYPEAIPVLRSAYLYFEEEQNKPAQASAQEYLAKSYLYTGQMDKATETYQQAYQLSLKHGSVKTFFNSAEALSEIYGMAGKHIEAGKVLMEAIKVADQEQDYSFKALYMSNLGIGYLRSGFLDSAQYFIEGGLALKIKHQDSTGIEMFYNHMGILYNSLGDLDKSIDYQIKALKILEAKGQKPQIVIQYNNIATIFARQLNLAIAEEYITKAITMAREEKLNHWLGVCLSSIGQLRVQQNREAEALEFYEESLAIFRQAKMSPLKSDLLRRIGMIYLNQSHYEAAETYFNEAIELATSNKNIPILIDLNRAFVDLNLRQNKLNEAQKYLVPAFNYTQKYNQPGKFDLYYNIEKKYYQALGDDQKALASFRLAQQYKEEQYNLEQNEKVHELEARYERAKKEQKIAQLNAENKVKDISIKKSRRNIFIGFVALLLALGLTLLLYYLNRTRRIAIERKKEKNVTIANSLKEKEILLREIHHRVKNNLQVVSSLLRLQTKYIKDEKALDAIQEGRNRVKSMSLIHQNLYQLDNLTGVQANDYIQKLSKSLFHSYNISPGRIHLETEIDELNIDVDTIIPIGLIINELLTNALKHAFPNDTKGIVRVTLKQEPEQLILEVHDNGIGISIENNGSTDKEGFGINLINSFLEKLKAELEIQEQNGTMVRLLIRKFKLV